MKGFIFNELFEMVGKVFSPEMVEEIIEASHLPNQGAYSDIGTYNYEELLRLVQNLSIKTGLSIPDLEVAYGKFLFTKLLDRHRQLVMKANSTFEFLQHVDNHIHVEVLKLYPEAELPRFHCQLVSPTCMKMEYFSNHPFSKLAEGLTLGCAEYFGEKIHIESEQLPPTADKQYCFLFTLTKEA